MKQELLLDTGCSSALAFNFNEEEFEDERQFMKEIMPCFTIGPM